LIELPKPQRWSTIFTDVEPPHSYVQDTGASVVHHVDYLKRREDHALCGVVLENPTTLGQTGPSEVVCPDCEAKLVEYQLTWWRTTARAATTELDELRVKYREVAEYADNQRRQLAALQPLAQGAEELSAEPAERRRELEGEPQGGSTAEQAGTTPTPYLDHALRELLDLCRRCDEAVPYWRLNRTMQDFSEKLNPDERVLLAQEIGADGSLIRWCTKEIESLGWRVTSNPVHGEPDAMWDAWAEDLYQTPKKTRWRLGWS
jgi:hypothetical protein